MTVHRYSFGWRGLTCRRIPRHRPQWKTKIKNLIVSAYPHVCCEKWLKWDFDAWSMTQWIWTLLRSRLTGHFQALSWISLRLKASAHSFKRFTSRFLKLFFSFSMHLLPRMNVMLDFIWTLRVQLRGTRNKYTLKNLVHGRIRSNNTARSPDYKSTVITTRPQLAWYEMELNVHEICISIRSINVWTCEYT